jgi:hypothetical protein
MEKLLYAHAEFMYSVVLCSRGFPECRRGTEGSTEGHYTDWALAYYITPLLSRDVRMSLVRTSSESCG